MMTSTLATSPRRASGHPAAVHVIVRQQPAPRGTEHVVTREKLERERVWTAMWAAHVFAGRPTPVYPEAFRLVAALDLSMMVPALVSGGVLLWRRRAWGVVRAAIAGVQGSLYLAVLSINSLIAIERGLSTWPGELVIWDPLAAGTASVTLLLLASVRPRNMAR